MATKAEARPGVSKYDEQPKKVTTDAALNEVSPDSSAAAFSWLAHDLDRVRARREELGYDDKERAQEASRKAELAAAERRLAAQQAQVEALRGQVEAGDDKPAKK